MCFKVNSSISRVGLFFLLFGKLLQAKLLTHQVMAKKGKDRGVRSQGSDLALIWTRLTFTQNL